MKSTTSKAIIFIAIILSFTSCSSIFDIDKEGGTRITAELSMKDIVNTLSGNSQDPVFLEAMKLASQRQGMGESDFVTLFGQAFEEVDPNARLATIFLYEFKDTGITVNSSNNEVLKVLKDACDDSLWQTYLIMASRLDRYSGDNSSIFHKIKFNIKKAESSERILIELPDDESIDYPRLRKLIQEEGRFGFCETYNFKQIQEFLMDANSALAKTNKANNLSENTTNHTEDDYAASNDLFAENYPLFAKLIVTDSNTARVGMAQVKDTADINEMLAETRSFFPRNLKFAWTVKPETYPGENGESIEVLDLVALKMSRDNKCALGGEVITDARQDYGQGNQVEVLIQMNPVGEKVWKLLTGENIGNQIAIVLDGYVYSYPFVNCEIPNGRSSISGGGMTVEEAQDLANVLKCGKYPCSVRIIEEVYVEPHSH